MPDYLFAPLERFKKDFKRLRKKQTNLNQDFALFLETFSPDAGTIIPHTHGVRKVRMKISGSGKSGGNRIHYYFLAHANTVYLLRLHTKSEKEDLSPHERKEMAEIVLCLKGSQ